MNYDKIINLLQSPDEENWNLGLSILETEYKKIDIVGLALCYLYGIPSRDTWNQVAPNCIKLLTSKIGSDIVTQATFKKLIELANLYPTKQKTLDLLADYYSKFLTSAFTGNNISLIKVTLKSKINE